MKKARRLTGFFWAGYQEIEGVLQPVPKLTFAT